MTSIVSGEDIENLLWRSGVKDTRSVDAIMKLVDAYVLQMRRHAPAPRVEPFGYLAPGEADMGLEIIKCKQCEIPKKFAQYYAEKTSPTGHRDVCKRCSGPNRTLREVDPNLEIICSGCGDVKVAEGNYYRRPDTRTGYGKKCKDCLDGVLKCPVCQKRRRPTSFHRDDMCVYCEADQ